MLKTATLPQKNAAPVQCVATEPQTETAIETAQESTTDAETVATLLQNCVREKRDAKRFHLRKVAQRTVWDAVVTTFLFGIPFFLAKMGNYWLGFLAFLMFGAANKFVIEYFSVAESTTRQGEAALRVDAAAPHDSRTLAVLLDALPLFSFPLWYMSYFPRPDYAALFPALATALWNAGGDLPLVLTDTRRARLRGTLNALWRGDGDLSTGEADFCAAAIKALALVGDHKAERLLKRIAARDAPGANHPNRAFVHSLAADVLPLLTERAAENDAHTRAFRALVHTKNKVVDLLALHHLSQSIGEVQMQAVAIHYLRTGNRTHQMKCLFLLAPPLYLLVFSVASRLIPGFVPNVPSMLGLIPTLVGFYVLVKQLEAASENEKTRMRLVLDRATRTGSPAVLPDLLDLDSATKMAQDCTATTTLSPR